MLLGAPWTYFLCAYFPFFRYMVAGASRKCYPMWPASSGVHVRATVRVLHFFGLTTYNYLIVSSLYEVNALNGWGVLAIGKGDHLLKVVIASLPSF